MKKLNDMMVWTWAGWEPHQFYRRLGGFHEAQEGNALWAEEWFLRLESQETARKLHEAGINWVTTHFYKGFGLESERQEMEATARLIANYHQHQVKVFTYIQYGTIMPETITREHVQAGDWGRKDWNGQHDGHPYEYGDQYWRAKACANQPGFLDFLCRVIDHALDAQTDGIWIDNLNADGCHCECCQKAFETFVCNTVTDPWRELGLRDLKGIRIPRAERPRDPLFQCWVRFRCEEVRRSLEYLCAHARARRPDVVLAANIGLGNHQKHTLENGNWLRSIGVLDFTYAENNRFPAWRDGRIISQQWPMAIANEVGLRVVPGAGFGAGSRLWPRTAVPRGLSLRRSFAESAMHGNHAYGGPWGLRGEDGGELPLLLRDETYRQEHRHLADWYRAHHEPFSQSRDAAPVAILESFEASISDERNRRQVREAMEQMLLQQQIPFRYVLSDQLSTLTDVALLILPHILPMDDSLASQLATFVRQGGKILATGRTSLYDAWMRQRKDYALAELFGVHYSQSFEDRHHDAIIHNASNGCLFLPGAWGLNMSDGSPACRVTSDRIALAIREALEPMIIAVYSPLPHVASSWRRLPDGSLLVSLLNHHDAPVDGLTITIASKTQPSVRSLCPRTDLPLEISGPVARPGRWRFHLPTLECEMFMHIQGIDSSARPAAKQT